MLSFHKAFLPRNYTPYAHKASVNRFIVRSYPFETESYLVGKSIIVFVMSYCTLNWWFYKREREDLEDFYKSNAKEIKPQKDSEKEKKNPLP